MTPGIIPARRAARAAPLPARSRASAVILMVSAIGSLPSEDAGLQGCRRRYGVSECSRKRGRLPELVRFRNGRGRSPDHAKPKETVRECVWRESAGGGFEN